MTWAACGGGATATVPTDPDASDADVVATGGQDVPGLADDSAGADASPDDTTTDDSTTGDSTTEGPDADVITPDPDSALTPPRPTRCFWRCRSLAT